MNKKIIVTVFSFVFLPLLMLEAKAAIYKCTNAKQEIYYNDKPCPIKDEEKEFKAVKDPVNGYIPPDYVESGAQQQKSSSKIKNELDNLNISSDKRLSEKERLDEDNKNKNISNNDLTSNSINSEGQSDNELVINTESKIDTSDLDNFSQNNKTNQKLKEIIIEPIISKVE